MDHKRYLPVFHSWIDGFASDAMKKIDFSLSPKTEEIVYKMLWKRIWTLSVNILEKYTDDYIEEQNPFYVLDSELVTDSDLQSYVKEVAEKIKQGGSTVFDTDYPIFRKKVLNICDSFTHFFNEMIQRIKNNINEISQTLLNKQPITEITDFSGDGADVHNNGKTSIIVTTNAGKFLYKPHDCRIDSVFKKLCERYFSDTIQVPDVLYICEDYSFISFVTNKSADNLKDAARYYENLGGFCALLTFLNGSDFHEENILANETLPIPIDFETVFMSTYTSVYKPSSEEDMNRSAVKTSMFSNYSVNSEIRECSPLFDLSDFNIPAPVVDGKRISVIGFTEEFKEGFAKIYRRCLLLKDELLEILSSESDLKIRILIRNTNYYALFSDQMRSWKAMKGDLSDSYFLDNLQKFYPKEICEKEYSSMQNGDIPYFYLKPFSTGIFSQNREVVDNFLSLKPFEYLKESMSLRNEEELSFELNVIDRMIKNTLTNENTPKPCVFKSSNSLERATEIFKEIRQNSFFESPCKELCLVETKNENHPMLAGINFDCGKTGVAVFCAALSCITDDTTIKEESLALCKRLVSEVINEINVIFTNARYTDSTTDDYGIKLAIRLISKYTSVDYSSDIALNKLNAYKEKKFANKMRYDIDPVFKDCLSNGNAAIADSLVEKYIETSDVAYLEKAGKLLLKPSYTFISEGYPNLFCSGFMNGVAGIGYTLLRTVNPLLIESVFGKS